MANEIGEGRDGGSVQPVHGDPSGSASAGDGSPESISADGGQGLFDRIFTALSNRRRRYVLYYLEHAEPATISEIARHVVAWETDTPPAAIDDESDPVRHVLVALYHDHLPRLDDLGLIEYDHRSGDVRFRDCPEALLEVIACCRPREAPDPAFETD